MSWRRREETEEYLSRKQIHPLLQHLLQRVAVTRPDDPVSFIVEELEHIKSVGPESFLDNEDLKHMFRMIDLPGKGKITSEQLERGVLNLGISKEAEENLHSVLKDKKWIAEDEFITIAGAALHDTSSL